MITLLGTIITLLGTMITLLGTTMIERQNGRRQIGEDDDDIVGDVLLYCCRFVNVCDHFISAVNLIRYIYSDTHLFSSPTTTLQCFFLASVMAYNSNSH